MKVFTATILILLFSLSGINAQTEELPETPAEKLAAHSEEFKKEVIEVTDGVYVAIGYVLANSIMIEGDDGVIIVDVTGSPAAAEEVKAEFEKITPKPIQAIIYTHGHPDHRGGAKVFANSTNPEIYAHELVNRSTGSDIQTIIGACAIRQFGLTLPPEQFLNAGIGPWMKLDWCGFLPPTNTFSDRMEAKIAGINVVLQYAPGETDDQLYVWLPDKKVLLPGDNYYKTFPNLYTIRGSRYRDIRVWAESFSGLLGWFDGNATNLFPLSNQERTERLINLAGGIDQIRNNAKNALREGDAQWATGLADYLLALDEHDSDAIALKADALTELGENQTSANGRNYYLTQAQQLREKLND